MLGIHSLCNIVMATLQHVCHLHFRACANKFMQNMDSMAATAAAPKIKSGRTRLQRQLGLQSVGRSWPVRIKLDFVKKTLHAAPILL